jgi:DNA replication and repair protein RecF
MYLKRLYIRNFRNIANEVVEFSKGLNVFFGENAQGKSNLLEAIYFLSTGKSFRGASIHELIAHDEAYFSLKAEIIRNDIKEYLTIYFDKTKRKIIYNDTSFQLLSQILGIFPSVLLAPQDLELIMGYPAIRRRFINVHIAQCDPLYVYYLTRYFKAMKHRNMMLKTKNMHGIEIFEEQMAKSGKYLIEQRIKATKALNVLFLKNYLEISSKNDQLQFKYLPSCSEDDILHLMNKNRHKEIQLKSTLYGPHRDDFILALNDKNAKIYASEGQKRTLLAALKFSELKRLAEIHDDEAILGIDDFNVHLDELKQSLLLERASKLKQVIITSPIESESINNAKKFKVEKGQFRAL